VSRVGESSENRAERVWTRGKVPFTQAVADLFCDHLGHGAELHRQFGKDGCSGGGDEFVGFVRLLDGDAFEEFQNGGSGHRKSAVGAIDPAVTVLESGGEDLLDTEGFDPDADADDVRDGIQRADFVEVDLIWGGSMDFRFGDRDAMEDGQGAALHGFR
jgi:hypothetical protein